MFQGKVIRNESLDPQYRVKFTYKTDKCYIYEGIALFTRKAPTPIVTFDDYTDYLIERLNLDESVLQNIRLEVGQTVCDYIFNTLEYKKI